MDEWMIDSSGLTRSWRRFALKTIYKLRRFFLIFHLVFNICFLLLLVVQRWKFETIMFVFLRNDIWKKVITKTYKWNEDIDLILPNKPEKWKRKLKHQCINVLIIYWRCVMDNIFGIQNICTENVGNYWI